jgi:hypothetical protein
MQFDWDVNLIRDLIKRPKYSGGGKGFEFKTLPCYLLKASNTCRGGKTESAERSEITVKLNVQKCCTSLRAERLLVTGIGLESKIYSY